MASDQLIAEGLQSLFRETNPNSFNSLNQVVLHLQSKLGFDLSNKIDFIRSQINLLFAPPPPPPPQPQPQQPLLQQLPIHHINPNPNPNCVVQQAYGNVRQHVFSNQGYFARGPTEINFANPGGGIVGSDSVSTPPAKDSDQKPKRRGGSGGLNKLCGVTPQLQAIVGQPTMPRTEIVKQLWAYIRKHNLQDPSNKRKIICNEELRLVFEVDCTDMFQMNKLLAKHILRLDPTKDSGQQSKKPKVEESQVPSSQAAPSVVKTEAPANTFGTSETKTPQSNVYKCIEVPEKVKVEECEAPSSETVPPILISGALGNTLATSEITMPQPDMYKCIKEEREKVKVEECQASSSETVPPIVISEALANFFGTSEMKMAQSDVYKRIEEYIKTEGLKDPENSMVRCDPKLQQLLGCESINASAIPDTLSRNHLSQQA
ncbi:uncharacterized protein LOC141646804 [Silene latifolia]|uniref:uncharacterized protein LOC141646804 n=1 Tax=Silene latifolia TaxID=37657 RepID=UPI003D786BD3